MKRAALGQKKRTKRDLHGWLVLDKPYKMGSTEALRHINRRHSPGKIGHAGTLDPLATGVLMVALGEATKTVSHVMDKKKAYAFTLRFGAKTTTGDLDGEILEKSAVFPDTAAIARILPAFVGDIWQKPPVYSALKQQGKRAYSLARAGKVVQLGARRVRIDSLHMTDRPAAAEVCLHARTGKGTYIRTLAEDIADRLGALGHVSALRRLAVGAFDISRARSFMEIIDEIAGQDLQDKLFPVHAVLDDIPALLVGHKDALAIRAGRRLGAPKIADISPALRESPALGEGESVALMCEGRLVAVARIERGELVSRRVFNL